MAFIDEIIGNNEPMSIFVDEWKKEVFFKPFTLADNEWVEKHAKGSTSQYVALTIIRKCMDENGDKLFKVSDKNKLMMSCKADLLSEVTIRMKTTEESIEEAEKNSESEGI